MNEENSEIMENDYSIIEAIKVLKIHWKKLLLWSVLVTIITAGISLFLPNYYAASTTFYAASPDLAAPAPLSVSDDRTQVYGGDNDIDRILSIASSYEIVDFLIDTFNLYHHYNIEKNSDNGHYKVREKFLSLYEVTKTKFGGINLTVEDTSPEVAAQLANTARDYISVEAQQLVKKAQKKTIENYQNNILNKEADLKIITDSLTRLKAFYNIIDPTTQGEVISQNQASVDLSLREAEGKLSAMEKMDMPSDSLNKVKAQISGLRNKKKTVDQQTEKFTSGISVIKALESTVVIKNDQVSLMKERYGQLISTYGAPFTSIHVVEEAKTPIIKSRPKRSIFTIAAFMLTFGVLSLVLLFSASLKKIDWDQ